jgi:hypothetical protein
VTRGEARRPRQPLVLALLASLVCLLAVAVLIEGAGQLFLLMRPGYEVVFLEPDRAVGWKAVPGLRFRWSGVHWYARDFDVLVVVNSHGFRDRERRVAKPEGTFRVALLGDSFVEALQVPLEQTAGQVLEARLNGGRTPARYEVLNFGISNYALGQYLLVWEAYARHFQPDVVVAFVANMQLARTVVRYEPGGFRSTVGRWLWVRPTFRYSNGTLLREPARDFDEFVRAQEQLVREEFGGRRMRRRASSVLATWAAQLWAPASPAPSPPSDGRVRADEALAINLAVLRELGGQVRSTGARFVIADAGAYLDAPGSTLPVILASLCRDEGFGYVPLGQRLVGSQWRGQPVKWPHDGHLNVHGNTLFAEAVHEWMAREHLPGAEPARTSRGTGRQPSGMPNSPQTIQVVKPTKRGMVRLSSMRSGSSSHAAAASAIVSDAPAMASGVAAVP